MPRVLDKAEACRGMTLVEILVSLSVSVLIVSVALSIFFTFSASFSRLDAPRRRQALAAMDEIRGDLSSCVQAVFTNTPTFEAFIDDAQGNTPPRSAVEFCTGVMLPNQEDPAQLAIYRVRYSLSGDTPPVLIRESACLWGPNAMDPPASNRMAKGVSRFEVAVLDGKTWTNRWRSATTRFFPRAARIRMDWQDAGTTGTVSQIVYIPAGNVIPAARATSPQPAKQTSPQRQ